MSALYPAASTSKLLTQGESCSRQATIVAGGTVLDEDVRAVVHLSPLLESLERDFSAQVRNDRPNLVQALQVRSENLVSIVFAVAFV